MKVLIVDDSALMRRWLSECLSGLPNVEIGTARDGADAVRKIDSFDPDVVTLDINMPVVDGLDCLSQIMTSSPRPVVMVSSLTEQGALATLEALELGAVDFVAKPSGTVSHDIKRVFPEIQQKVAAAAAARLGKRRPALRPARPGMPAARPRPAPARAAAAPRPTAALRRVGGGGASLVLVGASTGGPGALETLLCGLDAGFPAPILIAQHMPRRFTTVFARRLNDVAPLPVVEVAGPTLLEPGRAYLAAGDADVVVARRAGRLAAASAPVDKSYVWHPSVDRMVDSAMKAAAPADLVGVLLTGMGDDGADAMTRLRAGGGATIAEAEATATIFGMPKALIAAGGACQTLTLPRIAPALTGMVAATVRRGA